MDELDIPTALLTIIAVCVLVMMMAIGSAIEGNQWHVDCETLGQHREGSIVYTCQRADENQVMNHAPQ